MNKKSLLAGIVLGIAVVVSLGIVYIDNVKHYWQFSGGFVRLVVNTNAQASITVDTNTLRIGIKTNNSSFGVMIFGALPPADVASSTGTSANPAGTVNITAGNGGNTIIPTTGTGGGGGLVELRGGSGGSAPLATTNATGGAGGAFSFVAGAGSPNAGGVATNRTTGGSGGGFSITGGAGAGPAVPSTNTVGGSGGSVVLAGGSGGSPSAGWARAGGAGGAFTLQGGTGGNGNGTNGGNGGGVIIAAGMAGTSVAPGNPGIAGDISLSAANGTAGATNGNGGHVYVRAGNPSSTALPGTIYLARNSSGSARGGVVIGLGESSVTNILFVRTNLDFPSTLAQTDFDIPVATLAGRTNAVVNVGPPTPAVLTGSAWSGFCSNGTVFVRFSVYGLAAKDPGIGDFEVEMKLYQ